jgi:hypothetical protein
VERGWSGANEHYTSEKERNIRFKKKLFSKLDYLEIGLLLGYYCKLVLESADENVYLREKERITRFKKKNCFQNWITLRNTSRLLLGY